MTYCGHHSGLADNNEYVAGAGDGGSGPFGTNTTTTTAEDWYASGTKVLYDPARRLMSSTETETTIRVFEKEVVNYATTTANTRWITFLPGLPDGSYGYSKIEDILSSRVKLGAPRLFIEYVGQGESDSKSKKAQPDTNKNKSAPAKYNYNSINERANLVQAQWYSHNVKRTVVVAFDYYSSIVVYELLRRSQINKSPTIIEHVMCVNGTLTYNRKNNNINPTNSALLSNVAMKVAPRFLDTLYIGPMYSKEYKLKQGTQQMRNEIKEKRKVIIKHRDESNVIILSKGIVPDLPVDKGGKKSTVNNESNSRWDLSSVYVDYCMNKGITIELICSTNNENKHNRILRQHQDAKNSWSETYYPNVRIDFVPSGHMILTEQADLLATKIQALVNKGYTSDTSTQRTWVTLGTSATLPSYNDYSKNNQIKEEAAPKRSKFPSWVTLSTKIRK